MGFHPASRLISGIALAAMLGSAAIAMPANAATLRMAWSQDATGLDPQKQTAFSSLRLLELIYEPLVRLDAKLNVVPAIADSWEFSSDGLTLTFKLNPKAKFSNGAQVTSEDVKASFARILDEATAAATRANFLSIESMDTPDPADHCLPSVAAGCADPRRDGDDQRRHPAGQPRSPPEPSAPRPLARDRSSSTSGIPMPRKC